MCLCAMPFFVSHHFSLKRMVRNHYPLFSHEITQSKGAVNVYVLYEQIILYVSGFSSVVLEKS